MSLRLDLRLLLQRKLPIITIALLILTAALSSAQAAPSGLGLSALSDLKGTVDARPPVGTLLGDWEIGGNGFSVTNQTTFIGFGAAGPLVGACVEVSYNQATPATRIAVQLTPDNDCGAAGVPGPLELRGKITVRPELGADGIWTIGGQPFVITPATFFEGFGSTRPIANACVEVRYEVQNGQNIALHIQPDDSCAGVSSDHLFRGSVDSRPNVKVGDWVIGGRAFSVVAGTAFAASFAVGQPAVGDCVGLTYQEKSDVRTVATIFPANCTGDSPGAGIFESHGTIDVSGFPSTPFFGAWSIGGVSYSARDAVVGPPNFPATVFKQEFGKFDAGVCVEVHYRMDGATRVATRIETEPSFRCTRSAEAHELYGKIKQLPGTAGQIGPWSIGDVVVRVTPETKLTGSPFAAGQFVGVRFVQAGDGTLVAISIKLKRSQESERELHGLGKAYGVIGALPGTPPAGTWMIGDTNYTGTADTRVAPVGYTPALTDCVEVYYQTSNAGVRTALKISQAGANDCKDAQAVSELDRVLGSVTAMPAPAQGYVGDWTVAGVVYAATADTVFNIEHGPLSVGAFVEVSYVKVGGVLTAKIIRTIVPPGAGDDSRTGKLELPSSASTQALAASTAAVSASWVIGGKTYLVTSDTQLNDLLAALQNGANVHVNAFVNGAGSLVATQVTAVDSFYLPVVVR